MVWILGRSINQADSDEMVERQGRSDWKGMIENVLNDWTKTIHRSAEVITLI